MDFHTLSALRKTNAAWRLLTSPHAPLLVSFFHQVFVKPNERSLAFDEATSKLDDLLFHLNTLYGKKTFPKPAHKYLDDWANGISPLLRKYYIEGNDIPQLDLTPGAEKAIEWLQSLQPRQFVGTESRLLTLYRLLQDIVQNTEQDPDKRIAVLQKQRDEIDKKILKIRSGVVEKYDDTHIKERWFEAEDTARKLLSDFRQVEYNFRSLDQGVRQLIATSDKQKGDLLDDIFDQQDYIQDSEQGKSFAAFWEFLMSPQRHEELEKLTQTALQQAALAEVKDKKFLRNIGYSLLEAGEKVFRTNGLLVEQLRKYLADQAWMENKRILEIIKGIEKKTLNIRDNENTPKERDFMTLEQPRITMNLFMEKTMFSPTKVSRLANSNFDEADEAEDIDVDILYQQQYVDEARLYRNIRKSLQTRTQISLKALLKKYPLQQGLAELIAYFNIATKDNKAIINENLQEQLKLLREQKNPRKVKLPQVLFVR